MTGQDHQEPWFTPLEEAGKRLPAATRDELRTVHHDLGWACVAASEGQHCCMDHLLKVDLGGPSAAVGALPR